MKRALLALVAVLLAAYGATLMPGTGYSGDAAKFQFIGHILGTPHGPGYPLYVIANWAFTGLVPFGSLAWRANLFSALAAIAACVALARTLRVLGLAAWPAVGLAAAFGLSPALWRQAVVAEVYALQACVLGWAAFYLVRSRMVSLRPERDARIGCALYALSFGNHVIAVLWAPAVLWLLWSGAAERGARVRRGLWLALCLCVSALQYAFIFVRTAQQAPYLETQARTLAEFWPYATGAQFQGLMFAFGPGEFVRERLPLYAADIAWSFLWLTPLALLGLLASRARGLRAFLVLAWLGPLVYALNYDIEDINSYFLPSHLAFALALGLGLAQLGARWTQGHAFARRALAGSALALAPALFLIHAPELDQSRNTRSEERARRVLREVGGEAILLTNDYSEAEYLWYLLFGEGERARNLHVSYDTPQHRLHAHLAENKPMWCGTTRRFLPVGLPLAATSRICKLQLESLGYKLEPRGQDLWLARPLAPPPRRRTRRTRRGLRLEALRAAASRLGSSAMSKPSDRGLARWIARCASALALAALGWTLASAASAADPQLALHRAAQLAVAPDEPPPEPLDCFICAGDARLHTAWLRATLRALEACAHAAGHALR
jgi:hypothetical protein